MNIVLMKKKDLMFGHKELTQCLNKASCRGGVLMSWGMVAICTAVVGGGRQKRRQERFQHTPYVEGNSI